MQDEEFVTRRAMQAGAKGYVLKNSGIEEIMYAIVNVLRGGEHISANVMSQFVQHYVNGSPPGMRKKQPIDHEQLTQRERDVLELISMEKTSGEIAEKLELSKRTVEKHRYKLMSKVGAKSTVGLIKSAINRGWISSENIQGFA